MSDTPSSPPSPPRYYMPSPPPPPVAKPVPRWIAIVAAVLIVAAGLGSIRIYKSIHRNWIHNYTYINILHAKMTRGDDAGIFAQSDPAWQRDIGTDKTSRIFAYVRDQLGAPRSTTCTAQNVSTTTAGGTVLTLTFTTIFDKGTGTETLRLHKSHGVYRMIGYNVVSNQIKQDAIPADLRSK